MRTRIALYISFALVCFSACQKELLPDAADTANAMFKLYLQPEGMTAENMTRADVDENVVKELDVLVFDRTSQRYLTTYSPAVTPPSGGSTLYTTEFKMRITSNQVDLVLIANAHNEVANAVANFTSLTSRTDALAALTYKLINFNPQNLTYEYAWGTTTYRGIPMSGQLDNVNAGTGNTSTNLTTSSTPVILTRNVAKVVVNNTATSVFKMTGVWLYNMQTVIGLGSTSPKKDDATKLSVPVPLADVPYLVPHNNATTQTPVSRDAPYLVIGGTYNGIQTFYRIDFYTTTALDVEANHQYIFTITDVQRPGWGNQIEAAAQDVGDNVRSSIGHTPPAITVGINHPSLAYIHEEYLYLSIADVVAGSSAFDGLVLVETSNKDDSGEPIWTATSNASWLTVSKYNSSAYPYPPLRLTAQATTVDRSAEVTVTSNRLQQTIFFTQLAKGFAIVDSLGKAPVMNNDTLYLRQGAQSGFYQIKSAFDWGIEYIIIDDNPTPLLTGFTQTGVRGLTYWKYQIRPRTAAEIQNGFKRSNIAEVRFINIANESQFYKVIFKYKD